jgi:DNA-binding MurR/RpiR family transcriptional regulator
MAVTGSSLNPDLLLTIRGLLPALNEQEQKVGEYVLEHADEVIHLAVSDLGRRASVSDATVVRFCRKVGVGGYGEFKIRLAQELAGGRRTTYVAIEANDPLVVAVHKVVAGDMKALEDTLRVLDLAAVDRAADSLLAARRVDIYGSGGGGIAALEMQYKLIRVGVRAVPHTDSEMQVISATLLTPADLAIGISHSGESPDVLHALGVARQAGARTVAITNHPASAIAQVADVSLCTAAQERQVHGYPLGARVAQVALIDILYTCLALKRRDETQASLERIGQALHRRLE